MAYFLSIFNNYYNSFFVIIPFDSFGMTEELWKNSGLGKEEREEIGEIEGLIAQ